MAHMMFALLLVSLIAGCVHMSAEEIAKKMQEKESRLRI